jgi:hypothetical protein
MRLKMRQFVWSLALAVLLILVFAEIAAPIVQGQHSVHNLPVHKTLYIARNIPDIEMLHILEASLEWRATTNGEISFDLERMPAADIDPYNSVVMVNVTPDDPDVIISDNINHSNTLAVFNSRVGLDYIVIIPARLDEETLTEVVLHELGHSLGLKHIEGIEGVGCLMYPNVDLGCSHITKTDFVYLCKLYNCDPSKFHELP